MEVKSQIDKSQLSSNDTSIFFSQILKTKKRKSSRLKSLISTSTKLKNSSTQKLLSSITTNKLVISNIQVISKKNQNHRSFMQHHPPLFQMSCFENKTNNYQLIVNDCKNMKEYSNFKSNANVREKLIQNVHITKKGEKIGCFEQYCQIKKKWLKKILFLEKQIKNLYILKEKKASIKPSVLCQIQKDVNRSFDQRVTLKNKINLLQSMQQQINLIDILQQVLLLYSIYDRQLEYVQGMNLVAAQIVVHMKEVNYSYIYFKEVMNYGKLREFYLSDFMYLKKEVNFVLKKQLRYYNFQLYRLLQKHEINYTIFVSYYLVLFFNIIDIQYTHIIINQFMKHGIKFLHKFMIVLLLKMKTVIMEEQDEDSPIAKLSANFIKGLGIDWRQIIEYCQQIDLI